MTGEDREFCLDGDKDDKGSGMLVKGEVAGEGRGRGKGWKDVKIRHEVWMFVLVLCQRCQACGLHGDGNGRRRWSPN